MDDVLSQDHRSKMRACLPFAIPEEEVRADWYDLLDTADHWQSRCEQAERERDELQAEFDKLLYINSVLKILGESGLTPEQSVVELGKRLKDAEAERDELAKRRAADVALLKRVYDWPESEESLRQIGEDIESALRAKGEL